MTKVAKFVAKEGENYLQNGIIRVNPNKPKYGSIMVVEEKTVLTAGFLNKKTRVGFITGKLSDLESLGYKEGQTVPYKILVSELLESEVPENSGYRNKINPQTDEILGKGDDYIMWKTVVVDENSTETDHFVAHDCVFAAENVANVKGDMEA